MVYESKKKVVLANTVTNISDAYLELFRDVNYQNEDVLKELRDKPFFLIPKHQSWEDIIICAILTKSTIKKTPYYIMKDTLPSFLEYLGGLRIIRAKEIKQKELTREEKVQALLKAKEQKEQVYSLLAKLMIPNGARSNVLVSYIEGTRNFNKSYTLQKSDFSKLLDVQNKVGVNIPFIPLDIGYDNKKKNISVVVGDPLEVDNDKSSLDLLVNHFRKNIVLFD